MIGWPLLLKAPGRAGRHAGDAGRHRNQRQQRGIPPFLSDTGAHLEPVGDIDLVRRIGAEIGRGEMIVVARMLGVAEKGDARRAFPEATARRHWEYSAGRRSVAPCPWSDARLQSRSAACAPPNRYEKSRPARIDNRKLLSRSSCSRSCRPVRPRGRIDQVLVLSPFLSTSSVRYV